MDLPLVAPLIGAIAALIAALTQVVRTTGDHAWYRRWVEVLEHAETERDRAIARERIDHYVVEFAVADRTRTKRRSAIAVGVFLVALAVVIWTGGLVAFSAGKVADAWPLESLGWVLTGIALLVYVLALYLLVFFADRERARARADIERDTDVAVTPPSAGRWPFSRRSAGKARAVS